MSRLKQNVIRYTQEETIAVPSREKEEKLAIRRLDWNRIKRSLNNIPSETTNIYQIVYSILFTLAGSAGLSIYPIYSNPEASPWLFPLYVCVTLFSLGVAIVFCYLTKTKRV